jgi:hypothetical protein
MLITSSSTFVTKTLLYVVEVKLNMQSRNQLSLEIIRLSPMFCSSDRRGLTNPFWANGVRSSIFQIHHRSFCKERKVLETARIDRINYSV